MGDEVGAVAELVLKLLSPMYCAFTESIPPGNCTRLSSKYPKLFSTYEPASSGAPLLVSVTLRVRTVDSEDAISDDAAAQLEMKRREA